MHDLAIEREFEGAGLGDRRRSARLVRLATMLAASPERSFPRSASTQAALRAAYRFMSNDSITPDAILGPHRAQTVARAASVGTVIAISDSTQLEFPGEVDREGLGFI